MLHPTAPLKQGRLNVAPVSHTLSFAALLLITNTLCRLFTIWIGETFAQKDYVHLLITPPSHSPVLTLSLLKNP